MQIVAKSPNSPQTARVKISPCVPRGTSGLPRPKTTRQNKTGKRRKVYFTTNHPHALELELLQTGKIGMRAILSPQISKYLAFLYKSGRHGDGACYLSWGSKSKKFTQMIRGGNATKKVSINTLKSYEDVLVKESYIKTHYRCDSKGADASSLVIFLDAEGDEYEWNQAKLIGQTHKITSTPNLKNSKSKTSRRRVNRAKNAQMSPHSPERGGQFLTPNIPSSYEVRECVTNNNFKLMEPAQRASDENPVAVVFSKKIEVSSPGQEHSMANSDFFKPMKTSTQEPRPSRFENLLKSYTQIPSPKTSPKKEPAMSYTANAQNSKSAAIWATGLLSMDVDKSEVIELSQKLSHLPENQLNDAWYVLKNKPNAPASVTAFFYSAATKGWKVAQTKTKATKDVNKIEQVEESEILADKLKARKTELEDLELRVFGRVLDINCIFADNSVTVKNNETKQVVIVSYLNEFYRKNFLDLCWHFVKQNCGVSTEMPKFSQG